MDTAPGTNRATVLAIRLGALDGNYKLIGVKKRKERQKALSM
jgi:hypothetical protein